MILYLTTIFLSMIIISVFNIAFSGFAFDDSALWSIMVVIISVFVEVLIDAFTAGIVHSLPNEAFSKDKKIFQVSKKERNFYEKIKIRVWKDKVWELGACGGFRKNKISEPNSPEYLNKFIVESNKGIVIHILSAMLGFLVIFILPIKYAFNFGFWIGLVNFILNMMPTFVLRYNNPKLLAILKRAEGQRIRKNRVLLPSPKKEN